MVKTEDAATNLNNYLQRKELHCDSGSNTTLQNAPGLSMRCVNRQGCLVILDGLDNAKSNVVERLNSILEGNVEMAPYILLVTESGEGTNL